MVSLSPMIILESLAKIPAIIIAVTLHEYIRALVSTRLGDPVPKEKGRLTVNPAKHMDLFGALCFFIWGYGWGNPVQTSPIHYRDKVKGTVITYVLPSAANLFVGLGCALAYTLALPSYMALSEAPNVSDAVFFALHFLNRALYFMALFNITVTVLNLVPVYPLDGYRILNLFLPATTIIKLQQYEKIFQIILMIAIITSFAGLVFDPIIHGLMGVIIR